MIRETVERAGGRNEGGEEEGPRTVFEAVQSSTYAREGSSEERSGDEKRR